MANFIYPGLLKVRLEFDSIKLMLVSGYYPLRSHTLADVRAKEVAGKGYISGGVPLVNKRILSDIFYADDIVWSNSTLKANGCVLYTDHPILFLDFYGEKVSVDGKFEVTFANSGILILRV